MSSSKYKLFNILKSLRKFFLFTLIIFIQGILLALFAQDASKNYLEIRGMVDQEMQPLSGAEVELLENGNQIDRLVTGPNGTFSFKLNFDEIYVVAVSKNGLVRKKIEFNTSIPDGTAGVWVTEFAMSLFAPCQGLDLSLLEQPVAKIYFNEKREEFEPDRNYSTKALPRFDKLMEKNENCKNERYNQLIDEADKLLEQKDYAESKSNYAEARELFPDDRYVRKQIEKVDKLIAEQNATSQLYAQAVKEGDELFSNGNLQQAAEAYKKALVISNNETYPVQQIRKIDEMLKQSVQKQLQQQQLEKQYQQAINLGEAALVKKDYAGAVDAFNTALSVKAGDSFAAGKLSEANDLLDKYNEEMAGKKERENHYNEIIREADKAFAEKNYDAASGLYQQALTLKSEEEYPHNQLAAIEKIKQKQQENAALAAEEKKEADFNLTVETGEALLKENKYQEAKLYFEKALNIKPGDSYVQSRLSRIEKQVEKQKEDQLAMEKTYNQAVANADNMFKLEEYAASKAAYQEALSVKPVETYPKDQIAKID
ncbi:MAG TPA: hypothetical protein VE912_14185, partial [Bacteroidales bacterium]|nr:hypothetical protein [Bacteroidales bacterium]